MSTCPPSCSSGVNAIAKSHRKVLRFLLCINLSMFFVGITFGWLGHSHALFADSLDMLSDAIIIGGSIVVLNRGEKWKARAAMVKGVLMGTLSFGFLISALFRFLEPSKPLPEIIGIVGTMSLVANLVCAYCLFQFRNQDLNMRSTWLFTRNDILANLGVLISAYLVFLFHSFWPDILIGIVICPFILRSSVSILKDASNQLSSPKALS